MSNWGLRAHFTRNIGKNVFMGHIVKARDSIEAAGAVLVSKEGHCFSLSPLLQKVFISVNHLCLHLFTDYVRAIPGVNQNLVVGVCSSLDLPGSLLLIQIIYSRIARSINLFDN